ncbi:MAG: ribonuclease III [Oceanospirillaceae bacterium]
MRRINYQFKDSSLCELALTHRSCGKKNNERLEFLGDSIVNFVIAEDLFKRFPAAKEGQLSRLRAQMVKGKTLAEIARDMEMGDYLRLGSGELKSGGCRRESILADSVESLIGAIYLDSDMDVVRYHILAWFETRLSLLSLDQTMKDSKTRLQEFLQSRRLALPEYDLENVKGDAHDQTFYIKCTISELASPTFGVANSRRQAEQESAKAALEQLEIQGVKI